MLRLRGPDSRKGIKVGTFGWHPIYQVEEVQLQQAAEDAMFMHIDVHLCTPMQAYLMRRGRSSRADA